MATLFQPSVALACIGRRRQPCLPRQRKRPTGFPLCVLRPLLPPRLRRRLLKVELHAGNGTASTSAAAAATSNSHPLAAARTPPGLPPQQLQKQLLALPQARPERQPSFASSPRVATLQGTPAAQAPVLRTATSGMRRGPLGRGGSSADGPHSPRSPASITLHSNPSFDQDGRRLVGRAAAGGGAAADGSAPDVAADVQTAPRAPPGGWAVEQVTQAEPR